MRIAICAFDKPNSTELRAKTRADHLDYLATLNLEVAAAMKDEDGNMIGSILILDAPDLDTARTVSANDPYTQAGLFADVRIHELGTAIWPV